MFTNDQLDLIKASAKENQGEIAVYTFVEEYRNPIVRPFTSEQLNILKYVAEECKRQGSGEESVYDMVNAWNKMLFRAKWEVNNLTIYHIAALGKIVEPDNVNGFRTTPIFVENFFQRVEKAKPEDIERLLTHLLDSWYEGRLEPIHPLAQTPQDQFYLEFEDIHPFRYGNGRTGKILYNYFCGTLRDPKMPPLFWEN